MTWSNDTDGLTTISAQATNYNDAFGTSAANNVSWTRR